MILYIFSEIGANVGVRDFPGFTLTLPKACEGAPTIDTHMVSHYRVSAGQTVDTQWIHTIDIDRYLPGLHYRLFGTTTINPSNIYFKAIQPNGMHLGLTLKWNLSYKFIIR